MTAIDLHKLANPAETLHRCCACDAWVNAMLGAGPFPDPTALREAVSRIWWQLEEKDWLEAFAGHPTIGDLTQLREKFAATAQLSANEQAGVTQASSDTLAQLAAGNQVYQAKFGFIFIVCATGKSANDMLTLLKTRLKNDPQEELRIAAEEQLKITLLRLEQCL